MNEERYLNDDEMGLDEETRHILITDFRMTEREVEEHVRLDHRAFLDMALENEAEHGHAADDAGCGWRGIHTFCHGVEEGLSSAWDAFLRGL